MAKLKEKSSLRPISSSGQQATIKGKVTAQSILVQGKVMADVVTEKKLEIQPPGSVIGDVTTQSLVIGDGAVLEGHISMRKNEGRVLPLRQETKKEGASPTASVRKQRHDLTVFRVAPNRAR